MNNKLINIGFFIGYALVIAGAVVHILDFKVGFYILGIGALVNTVFRLRMLPKSEDRRIRRLNSQQFIVVAGFIATAYLMYQNHSAWALTLLISGIIDFYLTYRYPKT